MPALASPPSAGKLEEELGGMMEKEGKLEETEGAEEEKQGKYEEKEGKEEVGRREGGRA